MKHEGIQNKVTKKENAHGNEFNDLFSAAVK